MTSNLLTIIAGPCSIDENNLSEIIEISNIKINNKLAVTGTRAVGLKSRTKLDPSGAGMGMDAPIILKNLEKLTLQGSVKDFEIPPSLNLAKDIAQKTGMLIATEVMLPQVQLPLIEKSLGSHPVMIWNPAVNQLGWPILEMASYAGRNNWKIGIKNGKFLGEEIYKAESKEYTGKVTLEEVWGGLTHYASAKTDDIIMIHRGVEVPEKGDFRSYPVHQTVSRIKQSHPNYQIYFDPSHIYGPKMRDKIVEGTIEAMKMRTETGDYLYNGLLIEVGTSSTDTHQHITIQEFKDLVIELAKFREPAGR